MSTTPRPPLLSDEAIHSPELIIPLSTKMVRDVYEAARAKDAQLIQQLVDAIQQIADEGHWTPDMHELLNAAAAAGFNPYET
jgi:hypothetical protein